MKDQNGYLNGIAFPINEDSPIVLFNLISECSNAPLVLFYIFYQVKSSFQTCLLDNKLRRCYDV